MVKGARRMKTYRVYGEYIQRVFIDVPARDDEEAQDIAIDAPVSEWTPITKENLIDITGVDHA
jgi:hypothetical protein